MTTAATQYPFVPNAVDNNHCLQACYRMVVEGFGFPRPSSREAERVTGFTENLPTWQYRTALGLAAHGLSVLSFEYLRLDEFLVDPENALTDMLVDETLLEQWLSTVDLASEQDAVRKILSDPRVLVRNGIPTVADLRHVTKSGGAAICNVNGRPLYGMDGYSGHFVVVTEVDDGHVTVQNPGLPPTPNQRVPIDVFERGWYYPTVKLGNMVAVFTDRDSAAALVSR